MPGPFDHLIWVARQPGKPAVFLFGTMHLDSGLFPDLQSRCHELIDQIDLLATEIDLQSMENSGLPVMEKGLSDQLPARQYDRLRQQIIRFFDIDLRQWDWVPPLFIYQFLIEKILPSGGRPIDHFIWNLAERKQLPRTGLESIAKQMEIAGLLDLSWQLKSLKSIARSPRRFKRMIGEMVESYRLQRLPQLYRSSKKQLGPYRKLMLYDRNKAMFSAMENLIENQIVLVAVGAAHLWGNYGLIRLLKQAGYRVSPWKG